MSEWRNCENCEDQICYEFMVEQNIATEEICDYYEPLRCRCGGALSETRYHNGRHTGTATVATLSFMRREHDKSKR